MERNASASRILLVDDHDLSVRHAQAILDDPKHELHIARSAEEALDLALSWLPDLVFIDLLLDGTEGIEVIEKIRLRWPPTAPQPRVVVLTADRGRLDPVKARNLRIDRILDKPVPGRLLSDCVSGAGKGWVNDAGPDERPAELGRAFRKELKDRLPELDRCIARLEHDRVAGILHQLIASAAITGHAGLESALRALDAQCRVGGGSEEIAFCYQAVLQSAGRWSRGRL